MSFTCKDLSDKFQARVQGVETHVLTDVAPLDEATSEHLSFAESKRQVAAVRQSSAGAVFVHADLAETLSDCSTNLLIVDDPQQAFVQAMLLFRPPRQRPAPGIAASAIVSPEAKLGVDCIVHPGAIINAGVVLGDRCEVGPGVVIGENCRLGEDCTLFPYAVLYPNVEVGNRVIIHAHAVLGADGFGYRFSAGALHKIPHTGKVLVGDDVEIGASATIDRAMIGATVIGQGTKLDNQVMIAHNCKIGRHNAFASQVGLAGSVSTGDYVQMGGQVGIANHCRIGDQVKLGGKAGVMDHLLEPGVYHGIPAQSEREAMKNHLNSRKIPQIREQLKVLTKQVAELEQKLADLSAEEPRTIASHRKAA